MKTIHYVSHSCGPQECDCSPRCHAREGDEIVTSSSVTAVTCKNCLKGLKKDQHPGLPKSKTITEERDQLKAENEALRKIPLIVANEYSQLLTAQSLSKAKAEKFQQRMNAAMEVGRRMDEVKP